MFSMIAAIHITLPLMMCRPEGHGDSKPPADNLRRAIVGLGAHDYGVREKSERYLLSHGVEALPLLDEAMKDSDAEVRARAKRLSRSIRAQLLATNRRRTLGLIERFKGTVKSISEVSGSRYVATLDNNFFTDTFLGELEWIQPLEALVLDNSGITDRGFAQSAVSLVHLRRFSGVGTLIGDKSVTALARTCKGLTLLDLSGTRVTDVGVTALRHCPGLTMLALKNTDLTDNGFQVVQNLPELTCLVIPGTKVTDAGLRHLSNNAHLRTLVLDGTRVIGTGFPALSKLQSLETIYVGHKRFAMKNLARLPPLPNLRYLYVVNTPISDRSLRHLPPHTLSLSLQGCTFRPHTLRPLREYRDLSALSLADSDLIEADLEVLKEIPTLQEFYAHNSTITDRGLASIAGARFLSSVTLTNTKVTDVGVRELTKCPNLKTLDVSGTPITAAIVRDLPSLRALRKLYISSGVLTANDISKLKTANPELEVYIDGTLRE